MIYIVYFQICDGLKMDTKLFMGVVNKDLLWIDFKILRPKAKLLC